jgi:hypothetical protein
MARRAGRGTPAFRDGPPEDDAMTDPRPHEPPWLDLSEAAALTGL